VIAYCFCLATHHKFDDLAATGARYLYRRQAENIVDLEDIFHKHYIAWSCRILLVWLEPQKDAERDFPSRRLADAYVEILRGCQARGISLVIMPSMIQGPQGHLQRAIRAAVEAVQNGQPDDHYAQLMQIYDTDYSYATVGLGDDQEFLRIEDLVKEVWNAEERVDGQEEGEIIDPTLPEWRRQGLPAGAPQRRQAQRSLAESVLLDEGTRRLANETREKIDQLAASAGQLGLADSPLVRQGQSQLNVSSPPVVARATVPQPLDFSFAKDYEKEKWVDLVEQEEQAAAGNMETETPAARQSSPQTGSTPMDVSSGRQVLAAHNDPNVHPETFQLGSSSSSQATRSRPEGKAPSALDVNLQPIGAREPSRRRRKNRPSKGEQESAKARSVSKRRIQTDSPAVPKKTVKDATGTPPVRQDSEQSPNDRYSRTRAFPAVAAMEKLRLLDFIHPLGILFHNGMEKDVIITAIYKWVERWDESSMVHPTGSSVHQLGCPNSDADMLITDVPAGTEYRLFNSLRSAFRQGRVNGFLPMGTFTFKGGFYNRRVTANNNNLNLLEAVYDDGVVQIDVDITISNNKTPAWSAVLLRLVGTRHQAVPAMCQVIRKWADAHGLLDARKRLLNSTSLVYMVISLCQMEGVLPPITQADLNVAAREVREEGSLAEIQLIALPVKEIGTTLNRLVRKFFHFYANFSYDTHCIELLSPWVRQDQWPGQGFLAQRQGAPAGMDGISDDDGEEEGFHQMNRRTGQRARSTSRAPLGRRQSRQGQSTSSRGRSASRPPPAAPKPIRVNEPFLHNNVARAVEEINVRRYFVKCLQATSDRLGGYSGTDMDTADIDPASLRLKRQPLAAPLYPVPTDEQIKRRGAGVFIDYENNEDPDNRY
jgi:hypothetical protein